jgi:hypothetical protein
VALATSTQAGLNICTAYGGERGFWLRKEIAMYTRFLILGLGMFLIGLLSLGTYVFGQQQGCRVQKGCWEAQVFLFQDNTCVYYGQTTYGYYDNKGNLYTTVYTPNQCRGSCTIYIDPITGQQLLIPQYFCDSCKALCPAPVPYPVEAAMQMNCKFDRDRAKRICVVK